MTCTLHMSYFYWGKTWVGTLEMKRGTIGTPTISLVTKKIASEASSDKLTKTPSIGGKWKGLSPSSNQGQEKRVQSTERERGSHGRRNLGEPKSSQIGYIGAHQHDQCPYVPPRYRTPQRP